MLNQPVAGCPPSPTSSKNGLWSVWERGLVTRHEDEEAEIHGRRDEGSLVVIVRKLRNNI